MAQELPEHGYEMVRQFIDSGRTTPPSWDYLGLFDDQGSEVLRISVTGDARTSWTHTAGDQTLVVDGTFSGSDSDVPHGTTFTESKLFDESGVGTGSPVSNDTIANALINNDNDEVTVTHDVEVPQV